MYHIKYNSIYNLFYNFMYKSELSYKYGEYNAQAVDKAIQWSNNFGNNECSWQQPINHDQELENSSSPSSLVTQKPR